jgi:hypothetical protein
LIYYPAAAAAAAAAAATTHPFLSFDSLWVLHVFVSTSNFLETLKRASKIKKRWSSYIG